MAQYAANTCVQLKAALRAYDFRAASKHCRLLAGHSRRSVEPRAVPAEKSSGSSGASGSHEQCLWSDILACSATVCSVSYLAWRPSLSDHFAGLPALRKGALKVKNGKATTTWSVPTELYKFHLARSDKLNWGQPIPLYMLWCCVLTVVWSLIVWRTARPLLSRNQADRAQISCVSSAC